MDMRTRALSVLHLLYDLQDGWALLGVVLVIVSNLSRVSRWIRELNSVETIALILGLTLMGFWLVLRLATVVARLISAPVGIERPRAGAYVNLALHGQAGIPAEEYMTGVGNFEFVYRRWQPIELRRLTVVPQVRFVRVGGDWGTDACITVQPSAWRDTLRQGAWDYSWRQEDPSGIWELAGLPVVVQAGGRVPLPPFMLKVNDSNAAIKRFTQSTSAVLNLRFTAYTSAGVFTPEMEIPIVMQEPPPQLISDTAKTASP